MLHTHTTTEEVYRSLICQLLLEIKEMKENWHKSHKQSYTFEEKVFYQGESIAKLKKENKALSLEIENRNN